MIIPDCKVHTSYTTTHYGLQGSYFIYNPIQWNAGSIAFYTVTYTGKQGSYFTLECRFFTSHWSVGFLHNTVFTCWNTGFIVFYTVTHTEMQVSYFTHSLYILECRVHSFVYSSIY